MTHLDDEPRDGLSDRAGRDPSEQSEGGHPQGTRPLQARDDQASGDVDAAPAEGRHGRSERGRRAPVDGGGDRHDDEVDAYDDEFGDEEDDDGPAGAPADHLADDEGDEDGQPRDDKDDRNGVAEQGARITPRAETVYDAEEGGRRGAIGILAGIGGVLLVCFVAALGVVQGWLPAGALSPAAQQTASTAGTAAGRGTPTATSSSGCTPAVQPASVTVNVYNATSRSGLARSTAKALAAQGFVVGAIGDDPASRKVTVAAEVRHGKAGVAAAAALRDYIPGATLLSQDDRIDGSVDVVIGEAFTEVTTPSPRRDC